MWLDPPASVGCKWSASVARLTLHQWQGGLSANSLARFFLNSAWLRCRVLALVGMVATAPLSRLGLPRQRSVGLASGSGACRPCRVRVRS